MYTHIAAFLVAVAAHAGSVGSTLRSVGTTLNTQYASRLAGIVPARVRARITRIPRRRRVVVVGVLAGELLASAPAAILTATASPSSHTGSTATATAPANPAQPAAKAPGATGGQAPVPAGVSPDQVQNAQAIAQAAADRGLPEHATAIALATSLQESGLHNLDHGDRDSLGLFQQRPSAGWGTPDQIMDPHYSAGKFLDRLEQVPGWQGMPVTKAAQTVQRSAFPDAYAKWQPLADSLAPAVQPAAHGN
ncbi:MAG TPA: hypothetical protein VFX70_16210 [Mycobacteriales bacterium]|nr:hypothetical protein [Mycobacteriales bacterium]